MSKKPKPSPSDKIAPLSCRKSFATPALAPKNIISTAAPMPIFCEVCFFASLLALISSLFVKSMSPAILTISPSSHAAPSLACGLIFSSPFSPNLNFGALRFFALKPTLNPKSIGLYTTPKSKPTLLALVAPEPLSVSLTSFKTSSFLSLTLKGLLVSLLDAFINFTAAPRLTCPMGVSFEMA